jgi:hypothetical protein
LAAAARRRTARRGGPAWVAKKWRAGSQAPFAKAGRGRIGQLPGDQALLGKFSAIEGTSVRGKFARSRGGPEAGLGPLVQSRGCPEPGATEWVTGGARQAVESASAPQRARWLVVFRPVRRRSNQRQIGAKAQVPCRSLPRPSRMRGNGERRKGELRAWNRRSPGVPLFCGLVAEVGRRCRAPEAALGRG